MEDIRAKAEKLMSCTYLEGEQKTRIDSTRETFTDVAEFIFKNIKDSREKSIALTKIEEACMWAIKGITRE